LSYETVQLWDGKHYDASRLETLCPGVVEYAIRHPVLTERLEIADLEARRRQKPVDFRTAVLLFSLLVIAVAGGCLISGVPAAEIVPVVICVAVVSLVLLFAAGASRFRGETLPRTITVDGGIVTVETLQERQTFPLAECSWFIGKLNDEKALADSLAKGPAVILVPRGSPQLACGIEHESRERWKAFLEVASVRRVLRIGFVGGCSLTLLGLALTILAGLAGWYTTAFLVDGLRGLIAVAVAEKLPPLAATIAAWSACIGFYLAVPGLYRPTGDVKLQLYRFSALIPFVVLGAGRRGLGIVQWNLAERLSAIMILSTLLCLATWQILRVVDRRLRPT
jgi:hypothetical protein